MADKLTPFDEAGRLRMVDVTEKAAGVREAVAEGRVTFGARAFQKIISDGSEKGNIPGVAELAGVMGAKRTADLIPLCHPLPLSSVKVEIDRDDAAHSLVVRAQVKTTAQTGVEMEALTAASIACLTIYDMAKAVDKAITIDRIRLLKKSGGKSGDFSREAD